MVRCFHKKGVVHRVSGVRYRQYGVLGSLRERRDFEILTRLLPQPVRVSFFDTLAQKKEADMKEYKLVKCSETEAERVMNDMARQGRLSDA